MIDYTALVAEARTGQYDSDTELIDRLADAVEALVAEELYQRRTKEAALSGLGRYEKRLQKVEAERDALRAQLDGMTTEWALKPTDPDDDRFYGPYRDEPWIDPGFVKLKRTLTGWVAEATDMSKGDTSA